MEWAHLSTGTWDKAKFFYDRVRADSQDASSLRQQVQARGPGPGNLADESGEGTSSRRQGYFLVTSGPSCPVESHPL